MVNMENILSDVAIGEIIVCAEIFSQAGIRRDIVDRNGFGIIFSTNGKIDYHHNGNVYSTDRDHFILVPDGSTYYLTCDSTDISYVINFKCNLTTQQFHRFYIGDRASIGFAEETMRLYSKKQPGWQTLVRALIYRILAAQCEAYENERLPAHIQRCVDYIYEHYSEAALNNRAIAASANISVIYMQKQFSKYLGLAPHQYLVKVRMNQAKNLLSSSRLNISEIATMCGFSSVYDFSRAFKKLTTLSPLHYRAMHHIQI